MDYITGLAASGCYHFTAHEVQRALRSNATVRKFALNQLVKKQVIVSPVLGFYVFMPPEYQSQGCLSADQFLPALMAHLGLRYYVSLLSAAQYYGAVHQHPPDVQVFLTKNRWPIQQGMVRVAFMPRKQLGKVPVQNFKTPQGSIVVSSPEATALDLVGYADHVGGMDQVAKILPELAERIDPEKLAAAAGTASVRWAQRLGHLLECLGFGAKTPALKNYVREHAVSWTALAAKAPWDRTRRDRDWKLYLNADVEADKGGG
jgi:predicted transcriptional regulator of viral defense system